MINIDGLIIVTIDSLVSEYGFIEHLYSDFVYLKNQNGIILCVLPIDIDKNKILKLLSDGFVFMNVVQRNFQSYGLLTRFPSGWNVVDCDYTDSVHIANKDGSDYARFSFTHTFGNTILGNFRFNNEYNQQ